MEIFGKAQKTLRNAGCMEVVEILLLFMVPFWPILTLTLALMVDCALLTPISILTCLYGLLKLWVHAS